MSPPKTKGLETRHMRLRQKISGTKEIPRLSVHRSHLNLYTQLIDDVGGVTLLSVSTQNAKVKKVSKKTADIEAARVLGQILAEEAKARGITKVVFDRGGYLYHGKIRALAESAREHGLKF